jgi:hypothetical protein
MVGDIVSWFRYVVRVSEIVTRVPVPPEGLRPGQLGVVAIGRVIIGDVAATLVDLALRHQLRIDEDTTAADAGWLLTPATGSRSSDSIADYEQVLLEGIAGAGKTGSLSRAFQRDLRHLKSAEGPQAFNGRLLPYALHFGLTDPDQDLLVRFAHAFTATFADLPGWKPPDHTRPPIELSEVLQKPSIDEQIMDPWVQAGVWLTGW